MCCSPAFNTPGIKCTAHSAPLLLAFKPAKLVPASGPLHWLLLLAQNTDLALHLADISQSLSSHAIKSPLPEATLPGSPIGPACLFCSLCTGAVCPAPGWPWSQWAREKPGASGSKARFWQRKQGDRTSPYPLPATARLWCSVRSGVSTQGGKKAPSRA